MSAPIPAAKRDPEALKRAARRALDNLTGPERVETLRHYGGSAKKAIAANAPKRGFVCYCDEAPCAGVLADGHRASGDRVYLDDLQPDADGPDEAIECGPVCQLSLEFPS